MQEPARPLPAPNCSFTSLHLMAPRSKPPGLCCCVLVILTVTFWSCQATAEAINAPGNQQQQDTATHTVRNTGEVELQESPYSSPVYEPDGSYRREEDRYARDDYPPPGYDSRQQHYGRYEDAYGPGASMPEQPKYDSAYAGYRSGHNRGMYANKHEPVRNVYNFRAVPGSETAIIVAFQGCTAPNSPAAVSYTAQLTCSDPNLSVTVGTIDGTGVLVPITANQLLMSFTLTFTVDAGTACGVNILASGVDTHCKRASEHRSPPCTPYSHAAAGRLPPNHRGFHPQHTQQRWSRPHYIGGSLKLKATLDGSGSSTLTVTQGCRCH